MRKNGLYKIAIEKTRDLLKSADSRLLYLTAFGSDLYGTSTGASDLDVHGIFLPSLKSIILGKNSRHIHYSTASDLERNTREDLDIDLWSLENWLLHLLPEGNIGAIDLLFSPSNSDCTLFRSPVLDPVFDHPLRLMDLCNTKSWQEYCLYQTRKYGIRGSRLGTFLQVQKWLDLNNHTGRFGDYMDDLVFLVNNDKYCFIADSHEGKSLFLCGKLHSQNIKIGEFKKRIDADLEKYGESALLAEKNEGVDFKAVSHAVRALDEIEELLLTGKIIFPLRNREQLIKIKKGEIDWKILADQIFSRMEDVKALQETCGSRYTYSPEYAEKLLLKCYGISWEN